MGEPRFACRVRARLLVPTLVTDVLAMVWRTRPPGSRILSLLAVMEGGLRLLSMISVLVRGDKTSSLFSKVLAKIPSFTDTFPSRHKRARRSQDKLEEDKIVMKTKKKFS